MHVDAERIINTNVNKIQIIREIDALEAKEMYDDSNNIVIYRYNEGSFQIADAPIITIADMGQVELTSNENEYYKEKIILKEKLDKLKNSKDTMTQQINELRLPAVLIVWIAMIVVYPIIFLTISGIDYLYLKSYFDESLGNTKLFSNSLSALNYFHESLFFTRELNLYRKYINYIVEHYQDMIPTLK